MWMMKDPCDQLWVQCVSQDRNEEKGKPQDDVEHEEDICNDSKPMPVVWKLMEQDRRDTGTHCYDKPSASHHAREQLYARMWKFDDLRRCEVANNVLEAVVVLDLRNIVL